MKDFNFILKFFFLKLVLGRVFKEGIENHTKKIFLPKIPLFDLQIIKFLHIVFSLRGKPIIF